DHTPVLDVQARNDPLGEHQFPRRGAAPPFRRSSLARGSLLAASPPDRVARAKPALERRLSRARGRSIAPVYRARPTIAPSTPGIVARRRRSSTLATPPEARIGSSIARASPAVSSRFGPCSVPSRLTSV